MKQRRRRRCRHCGESFQPDRRNLRHQRYCAQPACRKESHAASQRRWLELLCPVRVRRVPKQFSWVDQRLVRDHYVERCDAYALALYLFLVTVADDQGLSYYSDATLRVRLSMDGATLNKARQALTRAQLITHHSQDAYTAPMKGPSIRLLALVRLATRAERHRGELRSIEVLLAQALGKTP
jgi:hypothetical protein